MFASGKISGGGISHKYYNRGIAGAWYDYDIIEGNDFITDNTWRDLDLSDIVPSGVFLVHIRFLICDDVVNRSCSLRKKSHTDEGNTVTFRTQVAQVNMESDVWVQCDENQIIQYRADSAVWTQIGITIRGWVKKITGEGVGAISFIDLDDTPANYTGSGGKYARVNVGETALEFSALQGGAGENYVARGDPASEAFDFVYANLTHDSSWRDLDLSAIVPEGATLVHLFVRAKSGTVGRQIRFRENGNSSDYNSTDVRIVVSNIHQVGTVICALDGNRKIQYWSNLEAGGLSDIMVRGWWTP